MPRLLLVDDEPRIARALEFALRSTDIELTAISNPEEQLESSLEASRPDVILLDIVINDQDGLALCSWLKRDPRFAQIPVVLFSGQTSAATKAAGLAAGADDFIPKPFVPTELIARVQAQIAHRAPA